MILRWPSQQQNTSAVSANGKGDSISQDGSCAGSARSKGKDAFHRSCGPLGRLPSSIWTVTSGVYPTAQTDVTLCISTGTFPEWLVPSMHGCMTRLCLQDSLYCWQCGDMQIQVCGGLLCRGPRSLQMCHAALMSACISPGLTLSCVVCAARKGGAGVSIQQLLRQCSGHPERSAGAPCALWSQAVTARPDPAGRNLHRHCRKHQDKPGEMPLCC